MLVSRRRILAGVTAFLFVVLVACGLRTEVFRSSFGGVERNELLAVSDVVVIARVADDEPEQRRIGPDYVWTQFDLEILKTLKGRPLATLTQPGGSDDGLEQVFPDVAYVEPGETYLMFLDTTPIGDEPAMQVIGAPQQVLFRMTGPESFENLDGSYRFTLDELEAAAAAAE